MLFIYPCKKPAAKRSPAPVKSIIFRPCFIPHSTTSSPLIATAPFSPLVKTIILPRDLEKLGAAGVNALFHPEKEMIYPEGFKTNIEVETITDQLCGKSRPDLFKGVATIIVKLFNIIRPQHAFFGEKDWQQLAVIEALNRDLNMDVQIHRVPLMREPDGLAMSSRNNNLSPEERLKALCLSKSLKFARQKIKQGVISSTQLRQSIKNIISAEHGIQIDYISICDPISLKEKFEVKGRTLIALAVKIGPTRLIDNCIVEG